MESTDRTSSHGAAKDQAKASSFSPGPCSLRRGVTGGGKGPTGIRSLPGGSELLSVQMFHHCPTWQTERKSLYTHIYTNTRTLTHTHAHMYLHTYICTHLCTLLAIPACDFCRNHLHCHPVSQRTRQGGHATGDVISNHFWSLGTSPAAQAWPWNGIHGARALLYWVLSQSLLMVL